MEHFSDILLNEGIVARDSSMVKLYSDALSIAPTDANILIVGASGTGKDCLAKFIHRHSPRAGAPFIHINCSAIPAELFESEFFGYESGAFTGSSASGRQGLIAQAAGGTLFLDEIGELGLDIQAKLLQVVQERSVRRIGSAKTVPLDIRIIAATVADTSEYGILRIIVSDPQKAYKILKENNVSANLTDVLAIVTSSCAGSFANTLSYFTKAGISIEYMYCFSIREKAILILRTNNRESAREVIRRQNLEYICESDLIKL